MLNTYWPLNWRRSYRPQDVAICTIHGNSDYYTGSFAERYAWPVLQIEQLRKYTAAGYRVFAYGHNLIDAHEAYLRDCPEVTFISSKDTQNGTVPHVWPIRNWLTRKALLNHRLIVHLDSDAFPVRRDWLAHYSGLISKQNPVVAVQRLENGDTHSDRSFLMFNQAGFQRHAFDFSTVDVKDAGGGISSWLEQAGFTWTALNRSNQYNYHPVIAALYDDAIYHHGAGTRPPRLRANKNIWHQADQFEREKKLHRQLMRRLFDHTDDLLAELRGQKAPHEFTA